MTKTQRILDLLPGTFLSQPVNSPLQTLVQTYGGELQKAENALAAIMRAHWCDQADLGARALDDLPRIAALYGLAPQPDDDIEEFRRRLKQWVRLILDGPATVRGLLRATSILTGLEIDDSDGSFDAWWLRSDDKLVTTKKSGRDAAPAILGFDRATATGKDARPARIFGTVPLPEVLDLGGAATLRVAIDGAAFTDIDLSGATAPQQVVDLVNLALGAEIADLQGTRMILSSPTSGDGSQLLLGDGPDDAALDLLGLLPFHYTGSDARAARFVSAVDLSSGVDLSRDRYLRLRVDDTHLAEIDCAGATPSATTLDDITGAINAALGVSVASHDGNVLILTSPTTGTGSNVAFQQPAAQDATTLLFGPAPTIVTGADAAPATLTGQTDLSAGVDLSTAAQLVFAFDGGAQIEVNCAGADPARTQLPEIIATINAAAAETVARTNGRNLILTGIETGPTGTFTMGQAETGDAALLLLGLKPRQVRGRDAQRAILRGVRDLADGVRLAARPLLRLGVNHHPVRTLDLSAWAASGPMTAPEIANALNTLNPEILAQAEDDRLVLSSITEGGASQIEITPVAETITRRFVSRVPIREDAAMAVLGVLSARAEPVAAQAARIDGTANLTRGVDLSRNRHLRAAIDGAAPIEIDAAGPRPRNTTSDEVLAALNAGLGAGIASLSSGGTLSLTSPTVGIDSGIDLLTPRAAGAAEKLLGIEAATVFGQAARQVSFNGTADLSSGVDLGAASMLKLAFDGDDPVEIDCSGPDPSATTLGQIAIAINVAMAQTVASNDGTHLLLTSPTRGADSRVSILTPAANDATQLILGVEPDRVYSGAPAEPAEIAGLTDLTGTLDLSVTRFLRLGLDTAPPTDIDCAAQAEDITAVTPQEIVAAINTASEAEIASVSANRLVLRATNPGPSSRLVLEPSTAGNAASALFGNTPTSAQGTAGTPATIAGSVDLRPGVDLSRRSVIRLSVDAETSDIDLAGEVPEATAPDEITAAINTKFPDMAAIDADGQLILTAPDGSVVELVPLRHFELVEYPPKTVFSPTETMAHGDAMFLTNSGAADVLHDVTLRSQAGVCAPAFVTLETGWELRLRAELPPGAEVKVSASTGQLETGMTDPDGKALPDPKVLALPLLPYLEHPADTVRAMANGVEARRQIVLNWWSGSDPIRMTELGRNKQPPRVTVKTAQALPVGQPDHVWTGWLSFEDETFFLKDTDGKRTADIRLTNSEIAEALTGAPVAITGETTGTPNQPVVFAETIDPLFDLEIRVPPEPFLTETFTAIALANPRRLGTLSAVQQMNTGQSPSQLVRADAIDPLQALTLTRGDNRRIYTDCNAARYDAAHFNKDHFAGGPCLQQGIFNVSRFAETPRADVTPVFAPASGSGEAEVTLNWQDHAAATAEVNLPLDMPPRFGARFDMDRFALSEDNPETIAGLVTEPPGDEDHFTKRLTEPPAGTGSLGLVAETVQTVPIGFEALEIPFSRPARLSGGQANRAAQAYISDPGVPGFIRLSASQPGPFGNRVSIVVCDSGPGRFDLQFFFDGARFENARQRVNGTELTGTPDDLSKPGPRGLQHLKAAGIDLRVTRDGTPPEHNSY